jgi:hypothetical protein
MASCSIANTGCPIIPSRICSMSSAWGYRIASLCPISPRTGSWTIRRGVCWSVRLSADHARVVADAVCGGPLLFGNRGRWVTEAQFRHRPARESLALVEPADIRWRTEFDTYQLCNMPRVSFRLGDVPYDLPLTDPAYAGPLQRRDEGEYLSADLGIPDDAAILFTVSLGDPLGGICYKLVAAVVVGGRGGVTALPRSDTSNSGSRARSAGSDDPALACGVPAPATGGRRPARPAPITPGTSPHLPVASTNR